MIIYILLVILAFSYFLFKIVKLRHWEKKYCIFMGMALLLIMGLRSAYIGSGHTDLSVVYMPIFGKIANNNMDINLRTESFGFYIFMKLFTKFSTNFNLFIFVFSIPYIVAVVRFIYKNSDNCFISFIILLSFNFYTMNFVLMKHSWAIAMLLLSFDYIKKRKPIKFVLCVIVATTFHITAIIFLIAYPLAKYKIGIKQLMAIVLLCIFANKGSVYILNVISKISNERYASYQYGGTRQLSVSGFIIQVCVIVVALVYYRNFEGRRNKNRDIIANKTITNITAFVEYDMLLNLCYIGAAFYMLSTVVGEFHRIGMYFSICSILLFPKAINCEKNTKIRTIIYLISVCIFVAYFLLQTIDNAGVNPYKFFWQ